jgi:hypothetical protein
LGDNQEKTPVPTPIRSLIPEELVLQLDDTEVRGDLTKLNIDPRVLFPNFLNLAERLGFGVDLFIDPESSVPGLQNTFAALRAGNRTADWRYCLVKGMAPDDGVAGTVEPTFSFVKIVIIPNELYELFVQEDILEGNWEKLLEDRSIDAKEGENKFLCKLALEWWKRTSTWLFDGVDPSQPVEVTLEHRGTSWLTVPVSGTNARVQLPLASTEGQTVKARVRYLTRYELIAQWLQADPDRTKLPDTSSDPVESNPVTFRPYYAEALPVPTAPIGFSRGDKIDFLITHPADEVDSAENLLTALRTGFRGLGHTFIQRPVHLAELIGLSIEEGEHIPNFDEQAKYPLELSPAKPITPFAGESVETLEHLSYYMETALTVRAIHDSAGNNTSALSPNLSPGAVPPPVVTYMRRIPVRKANAPFVFTPSEDRNPATIIIRLNNHRDLLTTKESESIQDKWLVLENKYDVNDLPDLVTSYLVLYKLSETNDVPAKTNLVPLFEILLPAHPEYKAVKGNKSKAFARSISSGLTFRIDDKTTSREAFFGIQAKSPKGDGAGPTFWIEVPIVFDDAALSNDKLRVVTTREGQMAIFPNPQNAG